MTTKAGAALLPHLGAVIGYSEARESIAAIEAEARADALSVERLARATRKVIGESEDDYAGRLAAAILAALEADR